MNYRTQQTRRWRKAHPGYHRKYMKRWYKLHPGYHAAQERKRREKLKLKENQMPTGRRLTEAQVTEIRELLGAGITLKAIAKKFGISESPVSRIKRDPKITGVPGAAPQAMKLATNGSKKPKSKYGNIAPKIEALRDEGLGVKAVAEKLGLPYTTVNYYFYGKKKYYKPAKQKAKERALAARALNAKTIGLEATNGHHELDTRFLVGFGCAELERTLTAIAERIGIAPNLLRQGFSKFLASQTVR